MAGLDDFLFIYLDSTPSERKDLGRLAYNKYYKYVKDRFNGDLIKTREFVQKTLGAFLLQDRNGSKMNFLCRENMSEWVYYQYQHKPIDKQEVIRIIRGFPLEIRQAYVDFIANEFYYEGVNGSERQILVDLIMALDTLY